MTVSAEYATRHLPYQHAHPSKVRAAGSPAGSVQQVLALQRQAGNRAVAGLLSSSQHRDSRQPLNLQRDDLSSGTTTATPGATTAAPAATTATPGTKPTSSSATNFDTTWFVDYAAVPQGGKREPKARGKQDRLIVEELLVGPAKGKSLKGGNFSPSGLARIGQYAQPGANGQVSGQVAYHQAKDIKIRTEIPVLGSLDGSPAPTAKQRDAIEAGVRQAAEQSVKDQWAEHEGETAVIEARAEREAKLALPEGTLGMVKVNIEVGGPQRINKALPTVDYTLAAPSNCYVNVDVPAREFAYHSKKTTSGGRRDGGAQAHGKSTETEVGGSVGGTTTTSKDRTSATDAQYKASLERRTKILQEYQLDLSKSFTRDFTKVWEDIATKWETESGVSSETDTTKTFTISTHKSETEPQLKDDSEQMKDPSLWERAKRAVKGFIKNKAKGFIAEKLSSLIGKNILFRILPGGVRKWVSRKITDVGWSVGEWLWDKITGTAKSTQTPEKDVTPKNDGQTNIIQYQEVVRSALGSHAMTVSEFKKDAGRITEHFESEVHESVRKSFAQEYDLKSSVDIRTRTGAKDSTKTTTSGSADARVKDKQVDADAKDYEQSSSDIRVFETDGVRIEGGEPNIRLLVRPY